MTIQNRLLQIDRTRADDEQRVAPAVIATDYPVRRGDYEEVLLLENHSSVDLSRSPLPLIEQHDHEKLNIGVVENIRVVNKKLRGNVRFGASKRAREIWEDVKAGVVRSLSLGYEWLDFRDEGETVFVTKIRPYETSLVSVPADPGAGFFRNQTFEDSPMETTEKLSRSEVRANQRAAEDERERARGLLSLGRRHDMLDAAQSAIEDGTTLSQFRTRVLDEISKRNVETRVSRTPGDYLDMPQHDLEAFSFMRAIRAQIDPKYAQREAGLEIEASRAVAKQLGREPQGLFVPLDALAKRDLSVGTAGAGGYLKGTEHLGGNFIELLRNQTKVLQLGATVLSGLRGDIVIPKQSAAATAYWVAEAGTITESQPTFEQVALSPKTVGGLTEYTRKLMLQSSPEIEQLIRTDLARVLAQAIDLAALYGSGASNQPLGIANVTGIGSVTFTAANPTFAEVVALETEVASANVDTTGAAYMLDATMAAALKTTEKASNTAQFILEDGRANGYRAETSNQVTAGDVIFGLFSDLIIGEWSGLDLLVDPYTLSASGGIRIVAFQDVDIGVRHPESFALGNDGA